MNEIFSRSELLLGEGSVDILATKKVAIFGIGGVGSYSVEALARTGIGTIALIDSDTVAMSNINRQLIADIETVGRKKVDVARERIKKINPACEVITYDIFYLPETADEIDLSQFDYVIDAVDTVSAKLFLIERCAALGVKLISSMGTGGKLDPTRFRVGDIYETKGDGLSKVMRRECRKRGIKSLPCVYSDELSAKALATDDEGSNHIPGSVAFVPSVAGLIIAGHVIKDILKGEQV